MGKAESKQHKESRTSKAKEREGKTKSKINHKARKAMKNYLSTGLITYEKQKVYDTIKGGKINGLVRVLHF